MRVFCVRLSGASGKATPESLTEASPKALSTPTDPRQCHFIWFVLFCSMPRTPILSIYRKMPEVVTAAVAGTITIVNGTFSLLQTFFRLAEVDEDLKIWLKLLAIVERDLNQARRQLQSCKSSKSIQISYADVQHLESAIEDATAATLSLGQLVQAYRVQRDVNKRISPGYRFKWVIQGKDQFASRQGVLNMAHTSLLAASQKMDTVALAVPKIAAPPPYSPGMSSGGSKILRSPSQQRTLKGKSSMILRGLEVGVPQPSTSGPPASQNSQSIQTQSQRSLPLPSRPRRMARTGIEERIGPMPAMAEEE
jgi:hypothetical protein